MACGVWACSFSQADLSPRGQSPTYCTRLSTRVSACALRLQRRWAVPRACCCPAAFPAPQPKVHMHSWSPLSLLQPTCPVCEELSSPNAWMHPIQEPGAVLSGRPWRLRSWEKQIHVMSHTDGFTEPGGVYSNINIILSCGQCAIDSKAVVRSYAILRDFTCHEDT